MVSLIIIWELGVGEKNKNKHVALKCSLGSKALQLCGYEHVHEKGLWVILMIAPSFGVALPFTSVKRQHYVSLVFV